MLQTAFETLLYLTTPCVQSSLQFYSGLRNRLCALCQTTPLARSPLSINGHGEQRRASNHLNFTHASLCRYWGDSADRADAVLKDTASHKLAKRKVSSKRFYRLYFVVTAGHWLLSPSSPVRVINAPDQRQL